jgi:hypothetical protein
MTATQVDLGESLNRSTRQPVPSKISFLPGLPQDFF